MFSSAPNSVHWYGREQVRTAHTVAPLPTAALSDEHCSTPPGHNSLSRPKSLLVSSPSTKLLSLEEAQARTQAQINSPVTEDSKYIEVGEGPAALQGKFHTVIEFPTERFVNSSYWNVIWISSGNQDKLYQIHRDIDLWPTLNSSGDSVATYYYFNAGWCTITLECVSICWLLSILQAVIYRLKQTNVWSFSSLCLNHWALCMWVSETNFSLLMCP